MMKKQNIQMAGMAAAFALAASMAIIAPASATEHETNAEEKSSHEKIHPIPGGKHCLHHVAQYDDDGNFVEYKTVKGPCN
jgi:hypothetical protein